ncbi:MAG: proprotein convertase P-domain-containing protein [Planctomycetota bacterium]|nr:proprotein convertase P-domain-containing protein [Planctomycetota bacterium]
MNRASAWKARLVLAVGAAMVFGSAAAQQSKPNDVLEKEKLSPVGFERLRAGVEFSQGRYTGTMVSTTPPPVIYGTDDRREPYEVSDPIQLQLAQACVLVVSTSELSNNGNGTYTLITDPWVTQGGSNVCATEPYRGQLTAGFCSGFLVGPDIITTAGHCVSTSNIGSVAFIFDFQQQGPGVAPNTTTIPADNVYFGTAVINRVQSGDLDHCVLRVDRPVVGRTPVQIRRSGSVSVNDPLVMVGHPVALPKKVEAGAVVKDANGTVNFFMANTDSYGGNSGSMVANRLTGVVEGILVRGNSDFVTTTGCAASRVCADTGCPTWEEISKATGWQQYVPPLGLVVTPGAGVLSQGIVGGPFTSASVTYTLSNTTNNPLNYSVSVSGSPSGLVSLNGGSGPLAGTLNANSTASVTVALTSLASSLGAGTYVQSVVFADSTNNINTTITHMLEVGQTGFDVTPASGVAISGPTGGPFIGSGTYTISSNRPTPVTVRVAPTNSYVNVNGSNAPQDFTLVGTGDSAIVTVNANAGVLGAMGPGLFSSSVTFTNQNGGLGTTSRAVTAEVGRVVYASSNVPVAIPDNTTVQSTLYIPDSFCIADLDVQLNISHTFIGDLIVELVGPTGTTVRLHNRTGSTADNIVRTYDQGVTNPDGPGVLTDFNNKYPGGTWTLRISDNVSSDTGTLNSWSLRIAPTAGGCAPEATAQAAAVEHTYASVITLAGTPSPESLTYTIATLPTHGTLRDHVNNHTITAAPNALAGREVLYIPDPFYIGPDAFTFTVSNGLTSSPATVSVTVGAPTTVASFPLDTNPGWSVQGQWAFGTPTGGGSGAKDPTSGFTGANVYGYNLAGDYANSLSTTQYLTSTPVSLSGYANASLQFRRKLGIESATYDNANIQMSLDGTNWTTLWTHTGATLNETTWSLQSFMLGASADNAATVRFRWGLGPTDSSVAYFGWNLDDIQVLATSMPTVAPCAADFDVNGFVDFTDFDQFVGAFEGDDAAGDFNNDGFLDFTDFDSFVAAFESGC